ncbi:hypothetical protein C0992_008233 [Termitomyces sp. T32_za158]|nr:hypothetical protein C0992_008233 [Termitomyces sp. T32_za158]
MLSSSLFQLIIFGLFGTARAVTVYGQVPFGQTSGLSTATATGAIGAAPTGSSNTKPPAAYDETILTPPPPPQDQVLTYTLNLAANNVSVPGISIMQHGSHIQVPFLNLMAQIQQRAGGVHIRMGGNTQDFAYWVDSIPDGHATSKEKSDPKNPVRLFPFLLVR